MQNNDKKNENEKKTSEKFSAFLSKASDLGKKAADAVSQGAKDLSEKMKEDQKEREAKREEKEKEREKERLEKERERLNPLTAKEYKSKNFHLPNIVVIEDDSTYRNHELFDGAIGWRTMEKETEVFHLYYAWLGQADLNFIPAPSIGDVYYRDQFDRTRFVRIDDIFRKAHEERIAELEQIAYCLGAKSCTIEVVEEQATTDKSSIKAGLSVNKAGASAGNESRQGSFHSRSGRSVMHFEGNTEPKRPTLKWFKDEDSIAGLIEMRCGGNNSIKSRVLELYGTSTATMSQKVACAIDGIMKVKASMSMEKQAQKEHSSKLIFEIEF